MNHKKQKTIDDKIYVIDCGGTISSEYEDHLRAPASVPKLIKGQIKRALDYLTFKGEIDEGQRSKISTEENEKIADSKYFTRGDIIKLAEKIRDHEGNNFMISFGSDRVAQASRRMKYTLKQMDVDKNVVFVVAYVPIENAVEEKNNGQFDGKEFRADAIEFSDAFSNIMGGINYLNKVITKSLFTNDKKGSNVVISVERGRIFEPENAKKVELPADDGIKKFQMQNSPSKLRNFFENLIIN